MGEIFQGWVTVNSAQEALKVVAKAATHATVQGTIATMDGGDFGSSFLSGFAGSMVGTAGDALKWGTVGTVSSAMLMGGVSSELSGGEFWRGAANGGIVAGANHVAHRVGASAEEKVRQKRQQKQKPEFYYKALDGLELNDGNILSRDDFLLTFKEDPNANATYLGFKNGKHNINFSISGYEETVENIQALTIHEAYGHGVMGFSDKNSNHYKAYWAVIDSKYWGSTSLRFKENTAYGMWSTWTNSGRYGGMPSHYMKVIYDYHPYYKK